MKLEERVLKYINSSDDFLVDGKRYCENDFYNDVEDLAKENQKLKKQLEEYKLITIDYQELEAKNQKLKEVIDKSIEYLETKRIREKAIIDIDVLEGILKEVE